MYDKKSVGVVIVLLFLVVPLIYAGNTYGEGTYGSGIYGGAAPEINVFYPTNTTYTTSTIYFNATANETVDMWVINYNGTNITDFTINTSLSVEDGNHHLFLYANDSYGNLGLNDTIYFSVDSTLPVISNAEINESSSVLNNSIVKVNASITDDNLNASSIILQIVPPTATTYNTTYSQSGDEFYNDTIVLNDIGQWVFKFYASDTYGNNATPAIAVDQASNSFINVQSLGTLNVTLITPTGITNNQPMNETFLLTANVTCVGSTGSICGEVNGTIRYNLSSANPDTNLQGDDVYTTPFYTVESNPQSCGVLLSQGDDACNLTWTVNATGAIGTYYTLDVNFTSNRSIASNKTNYTAIKIIFPILSLSLSNSLMNVDFGNEAVPGTDNNPAVNNSGGLYNITCYHGGANCNISIKGNFNLISGINLIEIGNISWNTLEDNSTATNMTASYVTINDTVPDLSSQLIYFWLDVPVMQLAGDYESNFTILGESN